MQEEIVMAYKGSFLPTNREKYKGDWSKITYRSTWEKFFMEHLDKNPRVVKWNSEDCVIPYFSNADGKKRRYFMDFWIKYDDGQEFFVEVKPKKETMPPTKPVHLTTHKKKQFMTELYTYQVNQDKWKAASALADKMNIKFRILTEDGLRALGFKGLSR